MGIADEIVEAASGGGVAVARMEIARLFNAALLRLSARGRAGKELAKIADAAARSDEELAAQMDRLNDTDKQTAVTQLAAALQYNGDDADEQTATDALRVQAGEVHRLLINQGPIIRGGHTGTAVQSNTGQIVNAAGAGTVHAPFRVGGNYIADYGRPRPR